MHAAQDYSRGNNPRMATSFTLDDVLKQIEKPSGG